MRLAIFGGTFDPIHEAHLAVAREAANRFQLDRVLFIPADHPPHKAGATRAPYIDRLRMTGIACEGDPRFVASDLEAGTERSYSIVTIGKVRAIMAPEDELFFIIGADAFADIQTWHRWRDVVAAVRFIVASRPGFAYQVPSGASVERIEDMAIPASSSAIRAQLAKGEKPAGVSDGVFQYISLRGLYRM